jgi:hypothetical protein
MKPFAHYLAESERVYTYRIKIAGDVPADFERGLRDKMSQFDVVKMSTPRVTPVRQVIPDFPAFKNERVTIIDVDTRYPAIEPQVKQLAQLMNFDPNRIVMNTRSYEESMTRENDEIEDDNKDLLTDTDYPSDTAEQRALKKDYATGPYDHAVLKNAYRSDFTVAGGKTPPARTTNDLPQGVNSPMTKIKRPPKPATGARPQG